MNMLLKNRTYRVENMLDVDIHVLGIKYIDKDYFKIKVCYVYRNNPSEVIMDNGVYKLYFEDFKRWKLLS